MNVRMTNRQQLEAAVERIREARANFDTTLSETRREIAEAKAEVERRKAQGRIDEQFAARARSGGAGRDVQRIQELVDRGRLDWNDVLLGRGEEWMTIAVRRMLGPLTAAIERGGLSESDSRAAGEDDDSYFDNPVVWNTR